MAAGSFLSFQLENVRILSPLLSLTQVVEDVCTTEYGGVVEFVLNAQQLIVLAHAVGPAQGTGLDLTGVGCYGQVGDGCVFGFTRPVGDHRGVAGAFSHFNCFQRFGQGSDLVDLDQDRVGDALFDPFFQDLVLVTNRSSPTIWILSPSLSVISFQPSQSFSARPSSMEMIG